MTLWYGLQGRPLQLPRVGLGLPAVPPATPPPAPPLSVQALVQALREAVEALPKELIQHVSETWTEERMPDGKQLLRSWDDKPLLTVTDAVSHIQRISRLDCANNQDVGKSLLPYSSATSSLPPALGDA